MSFARNNFTRAGGETFNLIRSSARAQIWKVLKEGEVLRFETWQRYGTGFYEVGDPNGQTGIFKTLIEAEGRFTEINKYWDI